MRIIGIAQTTREYTQPPHKLDHDEFLWLSCTRHEFESALPQIQETLTQLDGRPLLDFHIQDLLSTQQPSHYDFTSYYDVIVFRRLTTSVVPETGMCSSGDQDDNCEYIPSPPASALGNSSDKLSIAPCIHSEPIGFIIYDRILLTVHADPEPRNQFAGKILEDKNTITGRIRRTGMHLPVSPDELMLRFVDFLIDSYTELRRQLTTKLDLWQTALLSTDAPATDWKDLFESRNALHQLEDLCDDQSSAIKAWQESIEDDIGGNNAELLAVRARDVIEHIERSRAHVHRLQASLESAIQLHFSATANRTNHIMRVLTVLTAIFLPMNLLTGLFGMNFANMFLTQYAWGFWLVLALMAANTIVLVRLFWKKRYL